jgi:aryl-alcohol dehydrogenase-like predicted oxidoreductase
MTIQTRPLGRTGTDVTILGYGAMELRGQPHGPAIDDQEAGRLLNAVLDGGINLIDTSIDYGRSEELIGRYLGHRRSEYFLASKCGCLLGAPPAGATPPFPHDYSPSNIRAGIEQSLRRLGTDRLDLVQVHMSPSRAQMVADQTIETLQSLREEGNVRFIGMSGTLPHLPDHIAMGIFEVFQIPYSAVQREHEDLITAAAAAGAGTLIRGGAARGGPAEDKDWRQGPLGLPEGDGQRRWESSGIDDLLEDMTRLEFVLRFTLSHPGLSSTIVGTSSLDHLRSNLAIAAKGPLPADLREKARQRLAPDGSLALADTSPPRGEPPAVKRLSGHANTSGGGAGDGLACASVMGLDPATNRSSAAPSTSRAGNGSAAARLISPAIGSS